LLAEDEPLVRRLATLALRRQGFEVDGFADGRSAWDAFREDPERYDVLVLDTVMPGLTGRALHTHVEALRPGTPTLFVSGYTRGALDDVNFDAGHLDFLAKPYGPKKLIAAIQALLLKSSQT